MRSLERQTYHHCSSIILTSEVGEVSLSQMVSNCDFAGIMRAGDTLSPEALYEFARKIVEGGPPPDVLYCDEDYLGRDGRTRCMPNFKPSWSPETLLGYHYTGRLTLGRRALLDEVGNIDLSLGDASEWDLILRLSERTDRVVRVPKCLYHNGCEPSPGESVYRQKVLESHLKRIGIKKAHAIEQPNTTFRVTWPLERPPRVSVVIPTLDKPDLIRRCVGDLIERTDYSNLEIILVDNGSTDPRTLALYQQWRTAQAISIVPFHQPFNYSIACNLGAAAASGDFLLFLNNDIEVIHSDWLKELVRWGSRPGVGVVGTKLLYPHGTIQHAGVGIQTTLMFYGGSDDAQTPPVKAVFGTPNHYRNISALMGACHLIKRELFDAIGGYDERSLVACSDDILCIRALKLGCRNVYTPYASLVHHEGSTRGWSNPDDDRLLLAQTLCDVDIHEDAFFHPELGDQATPGVRAYWLETAGVRLRRNIEEMTALGPEPDMTTLGANWSTWTLLRSIADQFPCARTSPGDVGGDVESAAWFVIDLLRRDADLSWRFPRALSAGADGEFCRWLCSDGIAFHGLPQDAAQTIPAAFTSQPGFPISRLIDYQGLGNPLFRVARIPSMLAGQGAWLFKNKSQYGISNLQIWWFLLETAEDPIRELVRVYLTNPAWQKLFPEAMSTPGWTRLARWLRQRYRLDVTAADTQARLAALLTKELRTTYRTLLAEGELCRDDNKKDIGALAFLASSESDFGVAPKEALLWNEHALRHQRAYASARTGLNVLGHFCTPCGKQAEAVSVVKSLQLVGIKSSCRDVMADIRVPNLDRSKYLGLEVFDTTLIHVQPGAYFDTCYERAGLNPRSDVHKIGMWAWEFERVPVEWRRAADSLDEVWAPSRFVTRALGQIGDVPVFEMTPGVELGEVAFFERARLGIPRSHTLFLFIFDANSITERKNPLGLITAFRRAFRSDDKATLAIKAGNLRMHPEEESRLRAAARQARVILLDQTLPRGELNGLIQACDCYVSLHRSEGFGLTMAEAMLLSKPVIATGYSGNIEFMDRDNSLLISSKLVPVGRQIGPYSKDLQWAEPSIAEAAEAMRWVHEHLDDARALGAKARNSAERTLSLVAAGKRFAHRLEEIKMHRTGKHHFATSAGAVPKSHSSKELT
jgi:GT2 family glycosyltransferase/glycosyltransferase involved in cell wall biosynthesis